jgi:O-antigen/teichoic acid export membrane protein
VIRDGTPRDLVTGLISQVGYKALGFVILALLARQLSHQDYGKLMFALSLCLLTAMITDLGASFDLVRRVAARPAGARRRLTLILSARLPLLVLYLIGLNVWVALTKRDLWPVAAGIALYAVGRELHRTFSSLFQGLHRIVDSVVTYGSGLSVLTLGVVLGVLLDRGLAWMVGCYVIGGVVLVIVGSNLARRRVGRFPLRWWPGGIRRILVRSIFLFALTAMSLVHFSADTLMLGYLTSYAEVARYEAAAKLLEASQFLVRPMTMILFPLSVQLATGEHWARLLRLLHKMFAGALGAGMLACAGVALLAGPIVRIVYSAAYNDSAMVLRVLYLSTPGLYVATIGMFLAASMHQEKRATVAMGVGVALNVAANLWAIPRFGVLGAAWVTVGSQSLIACWLVIEAYRAVLERVSFDAAAGSIEPLDG